MSTVDPLDQLRKLSALKDDGIVDVEEFSRMKADLLALVSGSPATISNGSGIVSPPPISFDGERVTQDDVADSSSRLLSCELEYQELAKQLDRRRQCLKRCRRQLRHFSFLIWARGLFRQVVLGRFAPVVVSPFLGALVGVVAFGTVGGSMLIGGAIGVPVILLVAVHLFVIPSDISVLNKIATAGRERDNLESLLKSDEPATVSAKARFDQMRADHDSLVKRFQSRRNQLLTANWQAFRGPQFEQFLEGVFECLGYSVNCTGKCGDQGVDLIAERGALRLAVQSKGYVNSVGNDAVQQVHAGLTLHRCNRCCVITNSVFTASAKQLAASVGCLLIDGSQINSLIFGKIEL
jgi:hypothetical protein